MSKDPKQNTPETKDLEPNKPKTFDQELGERMMAPHRKKEIYAAYKRFSEAGPALSIEALFRLAATVEGGKGEKVTDQHLDDWIDLAARCQWRLELAHVEWDWRAGRYWRKADPEKVRELCKEEKRVRDEKIPYENWGSIEDRETFMRIPFDRALFLLLVPSGKGAPNGATERRKKAFFPFFRESYLSGRLLGFIYPPGTNQARDEKDFVPPTDAEIKEAYLSRQGKGWPKHILSEIAKQYSEWKREKTRLKRAEAGKRSGVARTKPKSKSVKKGSPRPK